MKAVTTVIVFRAVEVTGGRLSCDDGDYHAITMTSPDGTTSIMLAGTPVELLHILSAARRALGT